jgi:hypothetical protein
MVIFHIFMHHFHPNHLPLLIVNDLKYNFLLFLIENENFLCIN